MADSASSAASADGRSIIERRPCSNNGRVARLRAAPERAVAITAAARVTLQELADRSGGRLYEADTLYNLSQAFSTIAEELRHQYALSYYPTNAKKDGAYRRVRVETKGPNESFAPAKAIAPKAFHLARTQVTKKMAAQRSGDNGWPV